MSCRSFLKNILFGGLFGVFLCAGNATASLIIGFSPDGSTTNFNLNVGQSQDVSVYAIQVGSTELTDLGLQGMGLKATFTPVGIGEITAKPTSEKFTANTDFAYDNAAGTLMLAGTTSDFGFMKPAAGDNWIELGKFSYKATSAGITTFEFGHYSPDQDLFIGDGGVALDELFFGAGSSGTYTLTFTAVPEPSSIVLACAALTFGAMLVRRQKPVRRIG